MGKPSIFSKDYDERMKKRKRRRTILFLVITLIVIGAWVSQGINMKNIVSIKKITFFNRKSNLNPKNNEKTLTDNNGNSKQEEKQEEKKEEGYNFSLSSGESVKVIYESIGKDRKFKYIHPLESKIIYDISPSGKLITIYDKKVQRIYSMNIDGKVFDITKPSYTSTNGTFSISREEQLKTNPSYIWCESPKFIDESTIAYVSQLPWFNKNTKYIWTIDLKNNIHKNIQNLEGNEIKFESLNEKGLDIIIDKEKFILKASGEILK
ncbi:hypothetical protein GCM10008905_04150 [Clostridium malenominatum]|uniref:Secreted protein n=1 Tax=Clostridium malenominatum TaxID=1539 RepID=A0ABN1INB7_9CLOT